jgi:hypothetical protein
MGLDMYLTAERFFAEYVPEEKVLITALNDALATSLGSVCQVELECGYWRKANAIHFWFVKNCQDGVDECQKTLVDLGQLKELLAIVDMVLDDNSLAHEILPPHSGSFFGNADVDEWYIERLQQTKRILEKIVNNPDAANWRYHYQSSW